MAIYRGPGGAPSATDAISLNQIIQLEQDAENSATAAAASESAAASSASAAQTAQTNAETAETNAEAAQAAAETAQTNAEAAETGALAAQTAAEAAQTASEAALDSFDDLYLGAKAVEPTLDNDGNALQDGALYWNTASLQLFVYDLGTTSWEAANNLVKATQAQAEAGTDDTTYMTPLKTQQALSDEIGTTVQAFDADTAKYDDVTANFTGTLQQAGSTVIDTSDKATEAQATSATDDTTYMTPAKTFDQFNSLPRKNYIINGNFDIWQRGTSFTVVANGDYTADRWASEDNTNDTIDITQETFTLGQTDVPNEPEFYLRYDILAGISGTVNVLLQRIEDVRTLAGKTVTLSFYAKAASALTLSAVRLVQEFGTGGTPSTAVSTDAATSVSVTTSWQKFEYTVNLPSISGKTLGTNDDDVLELQFRLPPNITNSFDIAQVQLEEGEIATNFEKLPKEQVQSLCDRYTQPIYPTGMAGLVDTASSVFLTTHLPVRMRTTPSVTLLRDFTIRTTGANTAGSGSNLVNSFPTEGSVLVSINGYTGLTTGQGVCARDSDASPILLLDAEL